LFPILAAGLFACVGTAAHTQTTVAGMRRFADTAFGFSFWYPAAWKVTVDRVPDPTEGGWFPDATIVKQLQIRNPAASAEDDEPPGVILQELSAPHGLTELGQSKSPSPVGIDQKYFFDTAAHQWMYAQLSTAPDGSPPSTYPAKISQRTADGLPIFPGARRHGAEVIVPIDRSHFLAISTMDPGGSESHGYLAPTVMAIRPGSCNRACEQIQTDNIRREAVKLRVIGETLGYWYKDIHYVYDLKGEVIRGADPKTFHPLSPNGPNASFATDGIHVYANDGAVIPGADPKTFVATSLLAARDAHHTYDWSSGNLKVSALTAQQ
jgi:hypothetical protein